MTIERSKEIWNEAIVRINQWLKNSTFEEMTVYYSKMRFDMALGLAGYPFKKEEWMLDNDFNTFVSDEEYNSEHYDIIINELYEISKDDGENILEYITR